MRQMRPSSSNIAGSLDWLASTCALAALTQEMRGLVSRFMKLGNRAARTMRSAITVGPGARAPSRIALEKGSRSQPLGRVLQKAAAVMPAY